MQLKGKRVAILATEGYEQDELQQPYQKLKDEGAEVDIVSDRNGRIRSWHKGNWGPAMDVDKTLNDANADDYNALMLPGGVMNPDTLRMNEGAIKFVRSFFKDGKPVAAICHAPQILINANVVENRRMTSYESIRRDLENAGAQWTDEEVVVDSGLVTSRKPSDLPAFNEKLVEEIREGVHEEQVVHA